MYHKGRKGKNISQQLMCIYIYIHTYTGLLWFDLIFPSCNSGQWFIGYMNGPRANWDRLSRPITGQSLVTSRHVGTAAQEIEPSDYWLLSLRHQDELRCHLCIKPDQTGLAQWDQLIPSEIIRSQSENRRSALQLEPTCCRGCSLGPPRLCKHSSEIAQSWNQL